MYMCMQQNNSAWLYSIINQNSSMHRCRFLPNSLLFGRLFRIAGGWTEIIPHTE